MRGANIPAKAVGQDYDAGVLEPDSLTPHAGAAGPRRIIRTVLITALFSMIQVLPGTSVVAADADTYSVTQEAWSGGMQSGEGNYMGNCVVCHGVTGEGDGPLADSLGGDIKPRSLGPTSSCSRS